MSHSKQIQPSPPREQKHESQGRALKISSWRVFIRRFTIGRSWLIAVALALCCVIWRYCFYDSPRQYSSTPQDWKYRKDRVKLAFITSWDSYEKYAWGQSVSLPPFEPGNQMEDYLLKISRAIRSRSVPSYLEEGLTNEPRRLRLDNR